MPRTINIPARDETLLIQGFEGGSYVPGPLIWNDIHRNIYNNPSFEGSTVVSEFRRNLVQFPNAENVTTPDGWSGHNGATVTNDNTFRYSGSRSYKCVTPGTGVDEGINQINSEVSGTGTHMYSAWVFAPSGSSMKFYAEEYTTGGAYVGGTSITFTGRGTWQRISATYNKTSASNVARLAVRTATTAAVTFWVDNAMIEQTDVLRTYFDGVNRPRIRENLIPNPRAVSGGSTWGSTTNGTASYITDFPGDVNTAIRWTATTLTAARVVVGTMGQVTPSLGATAHVMMTLRVEGGTLSSVSLNIRPAGVVSTTSQTTVALPNLTPGIHNIDITTAATPSTVGATSATAGFVLVGLASVAGMTVDATKVLVEANTTGDYFDGATANTGSVGTGWDTTANNSRSFAYDPDFSIAWSGTAYQSSSQLRYDQVALAGRIRSTHWSQSGNYSVRISPLGNSVDTFVSLDGDSGALRMGMTEGKTYTVLGTIRMTQAQGGSPSATRARRIVPFTKIGAAAYVEHPSAAAPNQAGVTEIRHTFTVPEGATEAFIRLYNGTSEGNGDVWWDNVMVIEGNYTGPFYYGDSPAPSATERYVWSSAVNASNSIYQTGVPGPQVWSSDLEGWSGVGVQGSALQAFQGMYSMQVPTTASKALGGLTVGESYTLKARAYNSGVSTTISVGTTNTVATPAASTWTERAVTFTADSTVMTATLTNAGSTLWDRVELIHHIPAKTAEIPEKPRGLAPEYRYFTVDLMTDEILAEIPFRGVTYECALKAAGKFSGKIPLTAETDSMDLYNSTMPGNTALFIVRNGVAVWGGIIWARNYQFTTRDLAVSASEFTSYFYHRKIWKTFNHQFGATVTYQDQWGLEPVVELINESKNPQPKSGGSMDEWGARYSWTLTHSTSGGPFSVFPYFRWTSPSSQISGGRGFDIYGNYESASPGTTSMWKSLPVAAGQPVSVGVWVRSSAAVSFSLNGRIHDGNGNWAAAAFVISSVPVTTANTWVLVYGVLTPANNGYLSLMMRAGNEVTYAAGATIDGSRMIIAYGDYDSDTYTDGDEGTSSDGMTRARWEGTNGASRSIRETAAAPAGFYVKLDNGSSVLPKADSTVKIEYYEPENFKYNGIYRVANEPTPTSEGFSLVGGPDVADLTAVFSTNEYEWIEFYTKEDHKFSNGDTVAFAITAEDGTPYLWTWNFEGVVEIPPGAAGNVFRIPYMGWDSYTPRIIEGTVSRVLPKGTYTKATVTVRQDAYDYIRTMIDSMFDDFIGVDFPNVYIEPGISTGLSVSSVQAIGGYAFIETVEDHGIAPGQAVQVRNIGNNFDGEFNVTDTPAPNVVVYARGGNVPLTSVGPLAVTISNISMTEGLVTLTTTAAHGLTIGQNITVEIGDPYSDFNGTWEVIALPSSTQFQYDTGLTKSYGATALPTPTTTVLGDPVNAVKRVEVTNNSVTLELADPVIYSVGDSVAVAGVNRELQIVEKSLDAPNSKATVKTAQDHGLKVGDTISVYGLWDTANLVYRSSTTTSTTFTTSRPHNYRVGDSFTIRGLDLHKIVGKQLNNGTAYLTTEVNHNISVGASIDVLDLTDSVGITNRSMLNNVATITTSTPHNFQVNDVIVIDGLDDRYSIVSKEATNGVVTITTSIPHNILAGSKIKVDGVGAPFDTSEVTVDEITATRLTYKVDTKYWDDQKAIAARNGQTLYVPLNVPAAKATGTVTNLNSFYNGEWIVTARGNSTLSFALAGEDQPVVAATGGAVKVTGPSVFNGTYTVTARTNNTLSYARSGANVVYTSVPLAPTAEDIQPILATNSVNEGSRTVTAVTSNTFTFNQSLPSASSQAVALEARRSSIFNVSSVSVTEVPTTDRFSYTKTGYTANVFESSQDTPAYVRASGLYNGTFLITAVNPTRNTITYTKTLNNYGSMPVLGRGTGSVNPELVVSTFGPFPGNADIGMGFETRGYTGINLEPAMYRGFELKSVGDALDAYSDNINGFEYRVDVAYDEANNKFTKTFVLIPINFPNPPAPGTVAPLSRYGADKLIFEYPGGNITEVTMEESAEDSATRFFATGENDLGPDAGPNIGVASSSDLLQGKDGRKWPLLDAMEAIDGINSEEELHAYAERYLSEAAPPYTRLGVSLNGSIAPYVGDYKPGDWCSLILRDPFAQMRLASELEPRTDVIVRKISSYTVRVPDGVTFPETVSLELVAEWEVDTRGK